MEERDYEAWLAGNRGTGAPGAVSGAELFTAKTCDTCHRPDSDLQGPYLEGIFGHEVEMTDGSTVIVDEKYLRESILDPGAKVVKGYQPLMPTYSGQLSEEELLQLIIYIKSLGADDGDEAGEEANDEVTEVASSEAAS